MHYFLREHGTTSAVFGNYDSNPMCILACTCVFVFTEMGCGVEGGGGGGGWGFVRPGNTIERLREREIVLKVQIRAKGKCFLCRFEFSQSLTIATITFESSIYGIGRAKFEI